MSDGNEKGLDGLKLLDTTANPAPLGLLGFGMTTVLLNMHNAGFFALGSMILAMGIFYGGLAQIVAGIMEWKKNNTFGATAFFSYGCFWLSLVDSYHFARTRYRTTGGPGFNGGLPAYVGIFHCGDVCWNAETEPGTPVRFRVPYDSFLSASPWRDDRYRTDHDSGRH